MEEDRPTERDLSAVAPASTEVVTHMKIKPQLRRPLLSTAKMAARVTAPALLGVGLFAFVAPGTAGATPATYTAQAQSRGLDINLFGTQLTGGRASASVDSGAPSAAAEGVGVLTPGLIEDQKASAGAAGQNDDLAKACSQGGGTPAGTPVGVTVGLACSSAAAAVTAAGVPSASATGEIAGLDVNLSSTLDTIIKSGGDQLFNAIDQILAQLNGTPAGDGGGVPVCPNPNAPSPSSGTSSQTSSGSSSASSPTTTAPNALSALAATASVPGTPVNTLLGQLGLSSSSAATSAGPLGTLLDGLCQTLTNIRTVVAGGASTLTVDIGPASASVVGTAANTALAKAEGATAEVRILPGVGCDASTLLACFTDAAAYAVPLIDIKVAPADAVDAWDGTNWNPSTIATLATVALNIPGDNQTITVGPGQSFDLLSGTPLETVIDLGSASASGKASANGVTANGASLDLAKGVNGGILLALGTSAVNGGDSPATPAAAPGPAPSNPPTPARVESKSSAPAFAPASSPAPSPTLVHTGAWWSGSLPYLGGLAGLSGVLLGWPRLRRGATGLGNLLRAARR